MTVVADDADLLVTITQRGAKLTYELFVDTRSSDEGGELVLIVTESTKHRPIHVLDVRSRLAEICAEYGWLEPMDPEIGIIDEWTWTATGYPSEGSGDDE